MIMGQTVLRQILAEIKSTLWYSLIADEASDISHNEQMNIAIRWVDSNYDIHMKIHWVLSTYLIQKQQLFFV